MQNNHRPFRILHSYRSRNLSSVRVVKFRSDSTPVLVLNKMVKVFRLDLDSQNQRVYSARDVVTGVVVVETDKPEHFNAITVTLKGYAEVEWSETFSSSDGNNTTTTTYVYHAKEEYVNETAMMWHKEEVDSGALEPGKYAFPFRFPLLSEKLPSSFEGKYGHIRYQVEAKISTGTFHFDKKVFVNIRVADRFDINVSALMSPCQYEIDKKVFSLLGSNAPISLTVSLPRTGFYVGEGIPLSASLDNGSGRTVTLRTTIKSTETFHAEGETRTHAHDLIIFQSPPVAEHTTFQWSPADLIAIPSTTPTISNCGIISLDYTLVIEAVIPWARNAVIKIPIVLGTAPPQVGVGQPLPPVFQTTEVLFNKT